MGLEGAGFNAPSQFRSSRLRKHRAPEDSIRFWLDHANRSVTDVYAKPSGDPDYHKECTQKAGLGFTIPPSMIEVERVCPKRRACAVRASPRETSRIAGCGGTI